MRKNSCLLYLVMSPIGALAGLILAAVITCLIPKQYESQAVIELTLIYGVEEEGSPEAEVEAPVYVNDEIERIKSRESLDLVIHNLNLEKRWNQTQAEAREILIKRLQVHSMRGTAVVAIRVRHANNVDARDIVLEIAKVCKARRDDVVAKLAERQMQELNQVISAQQEKVEALQQALGQSDKESGQTGEAFANPKRELETEQDMLQTLKNHQMAAKILGEAAFIHQMPRISHEPVFPNFRLNLVLGAVLGLFLSPLMTLLVIRRKREAILQRAS